MHGLPHRGQVDDGGDTGEILQEDAAGGEGDLLVRHGQGLPAGQRLDVLGAHEPAVLTPEQILEEDLQGKRQPGDAGEVILQGGEPEDGEVAAINAQVRTAAKGIQPVRSGAVGCAIHCSRPRSSSGMAIDVATFT